MRIVNPSFGVSETASQSAGSEAATDATDWRTDPIVLFSN